MTHDDNNGRSSIDKNSIADCIEEAPVSDELLERYPLLKDKSEEELKKLNKAVLKKLDWKFLPCITAMLLMKSVHCQSYT
jgi:hypothetical protein